MKGRRTIRAWAVIFWLLLWQAGAMAIDQRIILVSPLRVLARLTELIPTLDFWGAIWYSLVRITAGFLLGTAAGVELAAVAALCRRGAGALSGAEAAGPAGAHHPAPVGGAGPCGRLLRPDRPGWGRDPGRQRPQRAAGCI